MKIFHTSDWHIDQLTNWTQKKSDKIENISEMSEYHLNKIEEMINLAIEQKVNFFVFAWDLFEDAISNFKEKEVITNILIRYINKLKENWIHSIFLSWNHDIIFKRLASTKNSLSLLSDVDYWDFLFVNEPSNTKIEQKIYKIDGKDYRFLLFPYLKGEQNKEKIKKEIKELTKDWIPTILIGHLDIYWALYNWYEIQFTNLENPNVWTPDELEDLWLTASLLWHVHNHQILWKNKSVIYCWSPFRLSFNEENSKKWYYIHEIENNKINESKFIELKNRNWKTINYDYIKNWKVFVNLVEQLKEENINDWIVRIKLTNLTKEDLKYYPEKEISDIYSKENVFINRWVVSEYIQNVNEINIKKWKKDFESLEILFEPVSILKNLLIKNWEKPKQIEEMEEELLSIISEINA